MKWLNGIGFRFWLTANILILIAVLTTSSIHLWKEKTHLEESLRSEAITLANTIGSAVGYSMLTENYKEITPLVYSLIEQPEVQYVTIFDTKGTVVNHKEVSRSGSENVIIEKVPIIYFQKKVGSIEIAMRTDKVEKQSESLVQSTILIGLITSLISVLLSYWASNKLSLPLKRLVNATKLMTRGNRDVKVPEEKIAEINELVVAFNHMSKTIEHYERNLVDEINHATKSLSEKVSVLEVMSNIARCAIENDLDHKEIIRISLLEVSHFLRIDQISIGLWKVDNRDEIEIFSLTDEHHLKEETIYYKDTPIYRIIMNKRPEFYRLEEVGKLFPREEKLLREGIQAIGMLPLIAKDKFIGSLNLLISDLDFLEKKNDKELYMFANQIAIALDRASLYESLRTAAYHDFLTGLPNSRFLKERIEEVIEESCPPKEKMFAVLFLDLDRFKNINDTLGHQIGDLVLKTISKLLLGNLNLEYTISRMGGDEFIILLPNIKKVEEAVECARTILSLLRRPLNIKNYEIHLTGSIGIAIFPNDGKDADTLIKRADTAMYRVKESGKNNFAVYSPVLRERTYEQFIFENDLRKALSKDEFVVYYQPKINIFSGSVAGLEALVRWMHPERGIISPGLFIPIAEETGLIVPIGEFVIRTAAKQMMKWQKAGFPPIPVAVNISTRQFLQSNLVQTVDSILKETGLPPHLMEFEITETMTMNLERSKEILTNLKKLGIKISIDDFGTGYSSLQYLHQLPIDRLKIDQSFIENITSNENNAAIVSTIIHMAKNLELTVTAEGVETKSQAVYLQKQRCEEVQGYYFSRPLPADELERQFEKILKEAKAWKID